MEIFIAGSSRSGTTLMSRILNCHAEVHSLPELHFFERLWTPGREEVQSQYELASTAMNVLATAREGFLQKHNPGTYRDEAEALARETVGAGNATLPAMFLRVLHHEAGLHNAIVPCEHTPRNAFFVADILELYPEARVVFMVRDPRDVVLSQRGKWRRRKLSGGKIPRREALRSMLAYHPINAALLWRAAARAMEASEADPRVLRVRYEDLLADARSATKQVCEFLGLEWNEELLEVEQQGSSRVRDDVKGTGIAETRASAWRNAPARERADLALCQRVCHKEMANLGYNPEDMRAPLFHLVAQVLAWPLCSALGVVMNLRRVSSPLSALRSRIRPGKRGAPPAPSTRSS